MKHQSIQHLSNSTDKAIALWLEPYGEAFTFEPGASFKIVAEGEQPGELEVVRDKADVITVYTWSGSTCAVYQNDQLLRDYPFPVPPVPEGLSTRRFVEKLFRGKESK